MTGLMVTLVLTQEEAERVIARYTETPPTNDVERMLLKGAQEALAVWQGRARAEAEETKE